jgi:integrase
VWKQEAELAIERLLSPTVRDLIKQGGPPGKYYDGGGLTLWIKPGGTSSWIFRFQRHGRRRDMGLGAGHVLSLADARTLARAARRELAFGRDPLEARQAARRDGAKRTTFGEVAELVLQQREANGDSPKTNEAWRASLKTYVLPRIGGMAVADVSRAEVIGILEPLWNTKPETASRIRWRLEAVFDAAIARGLRTAENPAREGPVKAALGARRKRTRHHAAMPWREVPAFLKRLSELDSSMAAMALQFTILTAARTGEVLGTTWPELDLDAGVWQIEAGRMKTRRPHRVPLSRPAVDLLRRLHNLRRGAVIFYGRKDDQPLSDMALLRVLWDLKIEATTHGFRSSFRDWCRDTGKDRELAESALSHIVGGVEGAYARSDVFDRRKKLMRQWGEHCAAG